MKKVIRIFCILSLVTLALVGCSGSDETNAKKVAEEFITNIYTVDEARVTELNKLYTAPGPEIGLGVPKSKSEPSREYTEIMQSFDKNIIPLITKEAYEGIIADQVNTATARICDDGNYTAQVTDITLGKNIYENYEDKNMVRYYYETKLKFIATDGKAEKIGTLKGIIELVKESGRWKVRGFGIKQLPKLDK